MCTVVNENSNDIWIQILFENWIYRIWNCGIIKIICLHKYTYHIYAYTNAYVHIHACISCKFMNGVLIYLTLELGFSKKNNIVR